MDMVSTAVLSLFAAAPVGGLLGYLIARCSRFELGLATGLLVFGAVGLAFAVLCFVEYRDFAYAGPYAAWGEVVAIEDRPVNASDSMTSPVAVVRFTASDRTTHEVRAPGAGGASVGSHLNVVYDPRDPQRSRVADLSELRGGAIAMLLFGSFPVTFGMWLLTTTLGVGEAPRMRSRRRTPARERGSGAAASPRTRAREGKVVLAVLNAGMASAILWIGFAPGELLQNFVEGFGAIAAICAAYALWGVATRRGGAAWNGGMLVLALNFGVWAFALWLLR